jgi:hypothetical protein
MDEHVVASKHSRQAGRQAGITIEACGGGGAVVGGVVVVPGVEALEEGGAEREDLGQGDAAGAAAAAGGGPPAPEALLLLLLLLLLEAEEEAVPEAVGADADDHLPGVEAAVVGALAMPVRHAALPPAPPEISMEKKRIS